MNPLLWLSLLVVVGVATGKSITEETTEALPSTGEESLPCECVERYFKHYSAKGCSPVFEAGCDCPVRFECKQPDPTEDENECYFEGKTYQKGESVPSSNNCEICSCLESYSFDTSAEISCISIECPSMFGPPKNSSCYYVYKSGRCCPEVKCSTDDVVPRNEKVCELDGQTYKLGEHIYPKEDPCLICTCTEDWNGTQGGSCKVHNCMLEKKRKYLLQGCVPIYHEATCCPIEMYCGSPEEGFKNTTIPLADEKDIESGNACSFKGMNFKIGQTLEINHPTNCVTCTCSTPPDFTCVHQTCQGPPNDDYENCRSKYVPGTCCPTYTCKEPIALQKRAGKAPTATVQCSPVQCPAGCKEVTIHNSCPFCQCNEVLCSPPSCAPECHVQTDVPAEQCPGCECPDTGLVKPLCAPVSCPSYLREVVNPDGCSMCISGPVCSSPKCESGCYLERNVPDGECPRCVCTEKEGDTEAQSIQCSPVRCLPTCREVTSSSGCPSCVCEPACSPPMCEEGCHVDPDPVGPCPGCVCPNKKPVYPELFCSPVSCGPLCHEAFEGNGCPSCICDPQCSPPKCDAECNLEYDAAVGPCPVCVCDSKTNSCPPVKCGSLCRVGDGIDGCPTCFCDPMCSPPICDAGCHLEYDRSAGPCPACVCADISQLYQVQCSPPKCDPGCQIDYSTQPCPSCNCALSVGTEQCSMPKCDAPCHINYNAKPCPACDCDETQVDDLQCSPPKCEAPCFVDDNAKPCPACICIGKQGIRCSRPVCEEPGCRIDYNADPCPSCICDTASGVSGAQCSPPNCDRGCRVDFTSKPCPSCICDSLLGAVQCSMPKCDAPCQMNYETKPCPSCDCGDNSGTTFDRRYVNGLQCSPPKCDDPGCRIDYTAIPCPSCVCIRPKDPPRVLCSPPKCNPGCSIDYTTRPCPSCSCLPGIPKIMCSPPKCDPGCSIDYSTSPCPSCSCSTRSLPKIMCSPPKCDPGCNIDYSTKPCPSCSCNAESLPKILCSPPKCDPGCNIDYSTQPCPSCSCSARGNPRILCSPPKCDSGCSIDYSTSPCPSCKCDAESLPKILCSPPRCDQGCTIDYSTMPCPSCKCSSRPASKVQCSPPRCDAGCTIDYSTQPCPSCNCGRLMNLGVQCTPPKCEEGCTIDYTARPCPSCSCQNAATGDLQCSPVKCDPGCEEVKGDLGCPTCQCDKPVCSPPNCGFGCRVDYYAHPCPTCICERHLRRNSPMMARQMPMTPMGGYQMVGLPMGVFNPYSDSYCRTLTCGPGCRMSQDPPRANERCPSCICQGKEREEILCAPTQCRLPCRFEKFAPHICPICLCYPIPCPTYECSPGYVEKKFPDERCPRCVKKDSTNA